MDESSSTTVGRRPGFDRRLSAPTIWGGGYGLESFSQLTIPLLDGAGQVVKGTVMINSSYVFIETRRASHGAGS